jgi:hypothetical protein
VLVLLSYVMAPRPMDLIFTPLEVLAVAVSVLIMAQVAGDGESHWMEGVQLLAVYAILGIAFFFLPMPHRGEQPGNGAATPAAAAPHGSPLQAPPPP